VTEASRGPVPVFRWSGAAWGFLEDDRLYDCYGRQAGWLELVPGKAPDVFDLTGRFLGELVDHHYVLRHTLREEPVHRAPRVRSTHSAPPHPLPSRDARIPREDWTDGLPWPLLPPDPPAR
jgi:hypothetical protein